MSDSVILIGGGGHARVVIDCILASGGYIAGILDDGIPAETMVRGFPVLGCIADAVKYADHSFIIAIGNNTVRNKIADELDVKWFSAVHPSAVVSPSAVLGQGTVVMPNAVINAEAVIGEHCIVNTGAVVEHNCTLKDYVHVSPGAVLGGTVCVGVRTHIGLGAHVRNNTSVCGDCTIGVGAAVVRDICVPGTYIGVPAGRME